MPEGNAHALDTLSQAPTTGTVGEARSFTPHMYNELRKEIKLLKEKLLDEQEINKELKEYIKKEHIMELEDDLLEAKKVIRRYEIALDAANENVLIMRKQLQDHIALHKPYETFYQDFIEKHGSRI